MGEWDSIYRQSPPKNGEKPSQNSDPVSAATALDSEPSLQEDSHRTPDSETGVTTALGSEPSPRGTKVHTRPATETVATALGSEPSPRGEKGGQLTTFSGVATALGSEPSPRGHETGRDLRRESRPDQGYPDSSRNAA